MLLSLNFEIGKRLAVVGMNGSGKTTFIKLLCRLYDPTADEILLNGIDIRKYNYREYMDIFSVVFQDFRLFGLKLGENVAVKHRRSPLPVRSTRMRRSSFWMSRPPRLIRLRRRKFTVSSIRLPEIRPQSISPTGCPPASSVTRLPCFTKERSSSRAAMTNCSPIGAANTTLFGTHRRSIIRNKTQILKHGKHSIFVRLDMLCNRLQSSKRVCTVFAVQTDLCF